MLKYHFLRFLRPTDFLDVSDDDKTKTSDSDTTTSEKEILESVEAFYSALTTGDQNAIESIFSQSTSKEVSEVRHLCQQQKRTIFPSFRNNF